MLLDLLSHEHRLLGVIKRVHLHLRRILLLLHLLVVVELDLFNDHEVLPVNVFRHLAVLS